MTGLQNEDENLFEFLRHLIQFFAYSINLEHIDIVKRLRVGLKKYSHVDSRQEIFPNDADKIIKLLSDELEDEFKKKGITLESLDSVNKGCMHSNFSEKKSVDNSSNKEISKRREELNNRLKNLFSISRKNKFTDLEKIFKKDKDKEFEESFFIFLIANYKDGAFENGLSSNHLRYLKKSISQKNLLDTILLLQTHFLDIQREKKRKTLYSFNDVYDRVRDAISRNKKKNHKYFYFSDNTKVWKSKNKKNNGAIYSIEKNPTEQNELKRRYLDDEEKNIPPSMETDKGISPPKDIIRPSKKNKKTGNQNDDDEIPNYKINGYVVIGLAVNFIKKIQDREFEGRSIYLYIFLFCKWLILHYPVLRSDAQLVPFDAYDENKLVDENDHYKPKAIEYISKKRVYDEKLNKIFEQLLKTGLNKKSIDEVLKLTIQKISKKNLLKRINKYECFELTEDDLEKINNESELNQKIKTLSQCVIQKKYPELKKEEVKLLLEMYEVYYIECVLEDEHEG